jgi:nicotinamide riboside kinase
MTTTVAIIGAECTGKSVLAADLGRALPAAVVREHLRGWVERHGRVPGAQEQCDVLRGQIADEERAAATGAAWVVSDAAALMTAVYSLLYYADDSLVSQAVAHHRTAYAATFWCVPDLPWVADAGQRDGPELRDRGHAVVGEVLAATGLPVLPVAGPRPVRLATALAALT